jgi:hypothetical protein
MDDRYRAGVFGPEGALAPWTSVKPASTSDAPSAQNYFAA